jgi:hypothetical protein
MLPSPMLMQDVWNELCNTSNATYIMAFLLVAALIKVAQLP